MDFAPGSSGRDTQSSDVHGPSRTGRRSSQRSGLLTRAYVQQTGRLIVRQGQDATEHPASPPPEPPPAFPLLRPDEERRSSNYQASTSGSLTETQGQGGPPHQHLPHRTRHRKRRSRQGSAGASKAPSEEAVDPSASLAMYGPDRNQLIQMVSGLVTVVAHGCQHLDGRGVASAAQALCRLRFKHEALLEQLELRCIVLEEQRQRQRQEHRSQQLESHPEDHWQPYWEQQQDLPHELQREQQQQLQGLEMSGATVGALPRAVELTVDCASGEHGATDLVGAVTDVSSGTKKPADEALGTMAPAVEGPAVTADMRPQGGAGQAAALAALPGDASATAALDPSRVTEADVSGIEQTTLALAAQAESPPNQPGAVPPVFATAELLELPVASQPEPVVPVADAAARAAAGDPRETQPRAAAAPDAGAVPAEQHPGARRDLKAQSQVQPRSEALFETALLEGQSAAGPPDHVRTMSLDDLHAMVASFGVLGHRASQAWLRCVEDRTGPALNDLAAQAGRLPLLIRYLAATGARPSLGWLQAACAAAQPHLGALGGGCLFSLMNGLSAVGHKPDEPWLAEFLAASEVHLAGRQSWELSALISALAELGCRPGETWLDQYYKSSLATVGTAGGMTGSQAATVLASLAQLDCKPTSDWINSVLVGTRRSLVNSSAQQTTDLLAALARLRFRPPEPWLQQYYAASFQRLSFHTPQQCCAAVVSLARLNRRPRPLWLEEMGRQLGGKLALMSGAQQSSAMGALADLGFVPSGEWLAGYEQSSNARLAECTAEELCRTLSALAKMSFRPNASWLYSFIMAAYAQLDSFDAAQLALVFDCLPALAPHGSWLDEIIQICAAESSMRASQTAAAQRTESAGFAALGTETVDLGVQETETPDLAAQDGLAILAAEDSWGQSQQQQQRQQDEQLQGELASSAEEVQGLGQQQEQEQQQGPLVQCQALPLVVAEQRLGGQGLEASLAVRQLAISEAAPASPEAAPAAAMAPSADQRASVDWELSAQVVGGAGLAVVSAEEAPGLPHGNPANCTAAALGSDERPVPGLNASFGPLLGGADQPELETPAAAVAAATAAVAPGTPAAGADAGAIGAVTSEGDVRVDIAVGGIAETMEAVLPLAATEPTLPSGSSAEPAAPQYPELPAVVASAGAGADDDVGEARETSVATATAAFPSTLTCEACAQQGLPSAETPVTALAPAMVAQEAEGGSAKCAAAATIAIPAELVPSNGGVISAGALCGLAVGGVLPAAADDSGIILYGANTGADGVPLQLPFPPGDLVTVSAASAAAVVAAVSGTGTPPGAASAAAASDRSQPAGTGSSHRGDNDADGGGSDGGSNGGSSGGGAGSGRGSVAFPTASAERDGQIVVLPRPQRVRLPAAAAAASDSSAAPTGSANTGCAGRLNGTPSATLNGGSTPANGELGVANGAVNGVTLRPRPRPPAPGASPVAPIITAPISSGLVLAGQAAVLQVSDTDPRVDPITVNGAASGSRSASSPLALAAPPSAAAAAAAAAGSQGGASGGSGASDDGRVQYLDSVSLYKLIGSPDGPPGPDFSSCQKRAAARARGDGPYGIFRLGRVWTNEGSEGLMDGGISGMNGGSGGAGPSVQPMPSPSG